MVKLATIALLAVFACVDAIAPASATAGQLISVVENFTANDTELAAIDVRKYSEISILAIADGTNTQVLVYFLSEAVQASTAIAKAGVGVCEVPVSGLTIRGCLTPTGQSVDAFKVGGPFLGLVIATGGTPRTVSLKVWAK